MFFIMGIDQKERDLGLDQTIICPACGKFGHLQVFMIYTCLSLFFIPLFKWGKRYCARLSCCGAACELDPELGRRIARGEVPSLDPASLHFSKTASGGVCPRCGAAVEPRFTYCPHCGARL